MHLTFKYRLLTSRTNRRRLESLVEGQRQLYNAVLEERIDCYRKTGRTITLYDQMKSLTECRRADPDMAAVPLNLQRGTLRRLDKAFQAFFRRAKAGQKPGFPRFKGYGRFDTLEWAEFSGIKFDGQRIRSKAFGSIRAHLHRPLKGEIKAVRITRDGDSWYVCFAVAIETPERIAIDPAKVVGIDLGLEKLATLSTGESIPTLRAARKADAEIRRRSRALARCKRGSNRRRKVRARLAAAHRKIRNVRRTYAHQQSAALVRRFDLIAVEDLNVAGMKRGMHARSIADAGWATLTGMIAYKAEGAGKTVVKVAPHFTSQDCADCGARVPKRLADRVHECPECGSVRDRDFNAAMNVLRKAVAGLGADKVGQWPVPPPGNLG